MTTFNATGKCYQHLKRRRDDRAPDRVAVDAWTANELNQVDQAREVEELRPIAVK